MSHKRKWMLAILAVMLAAALLLFGWTMRHVAGRQASTEQMGTTIHAEARSKQRHSPMRDPALKDRNAEHICERTAPKTVSLYVTDSPDRSRLLDVYLAEHATGRDVPISHIKTQPTGKFFGFMNVEQPTGHVVCSVNTGLGSDPWMLEFDWDDDRGWRCTSIQGPIDGAYQDNW